MSAFYSNQPDPSAGRRSKPASDRNEQPADLQPSGDASPPHRLYDAETAMSFPTTDESGEPIELDAPPNEDDPTPEEIERRSEAIRDRWSDRVKKKRHLRAPVRWNVPSVPIADIDFPG